MAILNPATDAELDRLRALHAAGLSRNAIMRQTGWSSRFTSGHAKALGLTFDRRSTTAALAAMKADAKLLRAEIALGLLQDVQKLRAQMFDEAIMRSIGGRDNQYTEEPIDEPSFADKRAIMSAIGTALERVIAIDRHDNKDQADSAIDRWLSAMSGEDDEDEDEPG